MELPKDFNDLERMVSTMHYDDIIQTLDLLLKMAYQFGIGDGAEKLAKSIEFKTLEKMQAHL